MLYRDLEIILGLLGQLLFSKSKKGLFYFKTLAIVAL